MKKPQPSSFAIKLFFALLFLGFAIKACEKCAPSDDAADSGTSGKTALSDTPAAWPPAAEDGETVAIENDLTLKNYYVVFDGSGSMDYTGCSGDKRKFDAAKIALKEFAATVPAEANLGLTAFDAEGVSERVPLGRVNRQAFNGAVDSSQVGGATPLKDSIELAVEKLAGQARKQLGYGEYHLVVVTDGEAYPDDQNPRRAVNRALADTPIVIHTIGFCIDDNHSLNQPGRTLYRAANDPAQLKSGLKSVLAESPDFSVDEFK